MSLFKNVHQGLSKQVMEETYSYDQGYTPWNPTPYQPHGLGYNAYQSNGFGDAYYGYEDPSPPYPPSQNEIDKLFEALAPFTPRLALTSKSQLSEVSSHQRLGARHPTPSVELLLKTAGKAAHPRLGVQYPRPAWRLLFPHQSQESTHQQGHAQAPDTPRLSVGSL
ncbi:hypothetical protein PIB30_062585 [Stylosanthes scabra]|uniref:Uncharacterized protein n=1 Tax=Stylosanthes scabra TaxID=79078 RepID=A0ABU6UMU7_9FABA|nr:hypothetical protein [Stylosanthes scabra]